MVLNDFLGKGFRLKKLRGLDFDEVEVLLSERAQRRARASVLKDVPVNLASSAQTWKETVVSLLWRSETVVSVVWRSKTVVSVP